MGVVVRAPGLHKTRMAGARSEALEIKIVAFISCCDLGHWTVCCRSIQTRVRYGPRVLQSPVLFKSRTLPRRTAHRQLLSVRSSISIFRFADDAQGCRRLVKIFLPVS